MKAEQFKNIRSDLGFTQSEIAFYLGITQKAVSQYEIGFRNVGPTVRLLMLVLSRLSPSNRNLLLNELGKAAADTNRKRNKTRGLA